MPIVRTAAELRAARAGRPSLIVASEGADFLEGQIERLDEAYQRWALRHLQLTHYRPNELGDIQTEPSVHDGLTTFGAEVIRRCNAMGIVVDVAHGTFELREEGGRGHARNRWSCRTPRSSTRPAAWTRRIMPDHAKAIAATGGVIGIWPISDYFPNIVAYATDGLREDGRCRRHRSCRPRVPTSWASSGRVRCRATPICRNWRPPCARDSTRKKRQNCSAVTSGGFFEASVR